MENYLSREPDIWNFNDNVSIRKHSLFMADCAFVRLCIMKSRFVLLDTYPAGVYYVL